MQPRVEHEFLDSQVETATPPCEFAADAEAALQEFRDRAAAVAQRHGLVLAPTGTPPLAAPTGDGHSVTRDERYLEIANSVRNMARNHYVNGMHVHVSITSQEEGVRALNGLARWAPLLLAMSANSPLWQGNDTGFQSWRHIIGSSWPLNSYPSRFASPEEYTERVDRLLRSGLIKDRGLVSWTARLSARYPTLEVRLADVQPTAQHAAAFAATIRALVDTIATGPDLSGPGGASRVYSEELSVSQWNAARDGLDGTLVDPAGCQLVRAGDWLDELLETISPALVRVGDLERVTEYLAHLRAHGTPATAQRRVWGDSGAAGILRHYQQNHRDRAW